MASTSRSLINTKTLILPVFLAVLLGLSSQVSYLLFHILAESFAIFVAILAAVVVWQTYTFTRNNFLMYLGCGYFWVAVLDMMHTLTYKGMFILPEIAADAAIQLWIGTRYLEAILLLTAPWFLTRELKRELVISLYGFIAVVLALLVMSGNFPTTFIDGHGLTKFKIYSEYIIILILAVAILHFSQKRRLIDQHVFVLMVTAIVLTMMAELAFTLYIDLYGALNFVGHILKLFSFWLIFIAVVSITLREPFSAMSKAETYYDAIPDATIIVDNKGIIQHVNKAACLLANQSVVRLIGQNAHSIFHGENSSQKDCPICQSVMELTELSFYEMKISNKSWRDFSVSIIPGEKSSIEVIRDITEKKQTELAIEDLAASTLTQTGDDFFQQIVLQLAKLFDADYAFIGLLNENDKSIMDTLTVCAHGEIVDNMSYSMVDTPCANVFGKKTCFYPDNVQALFPNDLLLVDMGVQSYVGTPIFDSEGRALGIVVILDSRPMANKEQSIKIQEIYTTRVAAEIERLLSDKALSEAKQKLDLHVQKTPLGVIEWNKQFEVVDWNSAAEKIFGYTYIEAAGQSAIDLIVPDSDKSEIEGVWRSLMSNQGGRYTMNDNLTKDGRIIKCKWYNTPLTTEEGEIIGVASMVLDVTTEYQSQQALLNKESEQQEILDTMVDAVITINGTGVIHSFNKAAETLFGYTADEIIGQNVSQLMPGSIASQHDGYLKRYIETGEAHIVGTVREVEAQHKNKDTFPMRLSVAKLPQGSDAEIRFIGSCQDLTKIKQQEEQLRRSQKMNALGKLTGGISHDYNNMLGIILGYTELLKGRLGDQPELAEYLHEIHRAGERGANLTRKLLSFSKQKASEVARVDINMLLQNQQHLLEKTLTVRVKLGFNLAENIWPLWLSGSDLEDAILNISINAMHAIEGNGELNIRTSNEQLNVVDSKPLGLEPGDYVLLSITDTGCGMDKTVRERIFEPFYSTKGEKGTGLGLSQVYGFVERSKGAIDVYSKPGQGTCFTFYFPRYRDDSIEDKQTKNNKAKISGGKETILIVDDEPALLNLATKILDRQGYNVISVGNAKQALEVMETESIDLLFSDAIMPEMDGYQLASIVREKYPSIKIQLTSGFSSNSHVNLVDDALCLNLLYKPYNTQTLLQKIRELLDG